NVADEVVNEEMDDSLERVATTATSLDAEHDRGNINKTQSKVTPNEAGSQGTTSNLQQRVLDFETTKTTQANEIASLEKENMFGVNDLDGDEVIVDNEDVVKTAEETVNVVATTVSDVEITLAQALAELNSAKPKSDKVVIQEPEQGTTTTTPTTTIPVPKPPHDKGKGIMIEEPVVEQVKPMKRLEQMRLDEELAFKLQAEEEEERLAIEKLNKLKKPT
ncbi:hypothetical protein Tco_1172224, partial [Tanacetum coccineum]